MDGSGYAVAQGMLWVYGDKIVIIIRSYMQISRKKTTVARIKPNGQQHNLHGNTDPEVIHATHARCDVGTNPLFLEHLLLFMRALLLLALLTLTLCLSLFLQLCQTPLLPETNASS